MTKAMFHALAPVLLLAAALISGCGMKVQPLSNKSDWSFGEALDAQKRGQYEAAIIHYTRFIQENQGKPARLAPAYNNRAGVYRAIKDNDKALADYNQAVDLSSPETRWEYLMQRGVFLYDTGATDDALADFEGVIARNPGHKPAYYYRGLCWKRKGDLSRAEEDFKKAK